MALEDEKITEPAIPVAYPWIQREERRETAMRARPELSSSISSRSFRNFIGELVARACVHSSAFGIRATETDLARVEDMAHEVRPPAPVRGGVPHPHRAPSPR